MPRWQARGYEPAVMVLNIATSQHGQLLEFIEPEVGVGRETRTVLQCLIVRNCLEGMAHQSAQLGKLECAQLCPIEPFAALKLVLHRQHGAGRGRRDRGPDHSRYCRGEVDQRAQNAADKDGPRLTFGGQRLPLSSPNWSLSAWLWSGIYRR